MAVSITLKRVDISPTPISWRAPLFILLLASSEGYSHVENLTKNFVKLSIVGGPHHGSKFASLNVLGTKGEAKIAIIRNTAATLDMGLPFATNEPFVPFKDFS